MQDMCLQTSDDGSLDGTALAEWQVVSFVFTLGGAWSWEIDDLLMGGEIISMSKKQRSSQVFPGRMSRIINAGLLKLGLGMWWKLGLDGRVISGVGIGGRGCWVLVSPPCFTLLKEIILLQGVDDMYRRDTSTNRQWHARISLHASLHDETRLVAGKAK
jgi:hypothetical protein